MGGLLVLNSFGTERVPLSPAVAKILGQTTTIASFRRQNLYPNAELSMTYQQARGSFRAAFSSGIGSGNGVYLATNRTAANIGYSYTGIRRTSAGVSAGWFRTSSASLALPGYSSWQVGVGGSYKLIDNVNLSTQFDYRTLGGLPSQQGRNGFSFLFGINYSTSRLPLSIW
jgi:hypothetical protein